MTDYSIDIIKDTSYTIELNGQGPQGIQGERGIQGPVGPVGPKGDIGPANTLTVGSVTKGEEAEVTIEGESPNQTINFVLPKGDKGEAATITIGKVETVEPGTQASVINVGTSTDSILDFSIPRGYKGEAATIVVGSTTTSEPGTEANVVNSGNESTAILEFTIPKGEKGDKGDIGEQGPQGEQGIQGIQGPQGLNGISVTGVEQISKVGLVATYRMHFSDGTHFDYEVKDGSVDGVTREQVISLIGYEPASYTSVEGLTTRVSTLEERVEDLTASKFPNVVIIGTPHIEGGQVSGYSNTNYLQFPFVDISRGLPFDIYFSFTTGSDVTTQQNILDSHFGIALAIKNGKGLMALSSDGTSWNIGNVTGTNTILPNTTYYAKCSWTGTQYNASLSTNNTTYIPDMVLNSTLTTNKTTIFIGGSPDLFGAGTAHPFKGTINFNKSIVNVQGATVWEGMADVGLASRANVSLNNLDEVGEKRFTDIQTKLDSKQDKGNYALKSEIPTKISQLTDDSTFVHKTGNETVAGVKTFSSTINGNTTSASKLNGFGTTRTEFWGSVNATAKTGKIINSANTPNDGAYIFSERKLNNGANLDFIIDGKFYQDEGKYQVLDSSTGVTHTTNTAVGSASKPVYINSNGVATAITSYEGNSATATKATQDGNGNVITSTYLKKTEAYHPPLLSTMWSDHLLNDMSWLRADTFSWQDGNTYSQAYNELLAEYNDSASSEETEGSITFKRTPKGYKIALANQETAILNKYNSDGIAWYYILDTANKQFKLPRTKFGFEGIRTSVGDDIGAGLPNITGSAGYTVRLISASGAFNYGSGDSANQWGAGEWGEVKPFTFDASRSNPIYGNSNTVQPPATQMYLYFYVGNFTKSAEAQTAGLKAELLNGKADVTTPSIQAPYLKNTYVNGKSGYRIWSDGYCEQWGESTFNSGGSTVSLLKTMKSTEYIVTYMFVSTKTDDYGEGINVNVRTVSSFTAHGYHSNALTNVTCKWLVNGYLASGQY